MAKTSYFRTIAMVAAVVAVGLLTLVGSKPAWAESRSFAPAEHYSVGSTPTTVKNADFNGDGKADFAISNFGSDDVSVLLGNGDGTLQEKQDIPAGDGPTSVNSADFNKDGIADLAVSNQNSSKVSILLGEDDGTGKGDGTFQPPIDFSVGSTPSSVASADFNGDNNADLAVSNYGTHSVSVLLGNGDGTFQAKQDYDVSVAGINPNEVITADFNGDGKIDLATANIGTELARALGGVAVLLGNGDGTFNTASKAVTQAFNTSVAAADFNGDGKKDLVATGPVCCALGKVSVALANGDGTFQAKQEFGVGNGHTSPNSVSSADFDKDGDQDLAVSNGANSVSLLWGSGNGSFSQPSQEFPAGSGSIFVVGVDFNADSYVDLAVANQNSNNVSVLLNTPAQDTTAPSTTRTLSPQPNAAGWNKEDVTLTLSATDNDSGVKEITYSATGAQAIAEQTVPGATATLSAITTEGQTTISYHATDNAGNTESPPKTLTVKLDKTAPDAVTDLSAAPGNAKADLSWTNPTDSDFDKVRVLRSTSGAATSSEPRDGQTQVYEGTTTSYSDTGLTNDTTYYYTVFARDIAGNWSSAASTNATPTASPPPDTTPPTVVSVSPANSATKVTRNTNVTATFSEAMAPNTLTSSTVTLAKVGFGGKTTPVTATVRVSDDSKTVTLDPSANLGSFVTYRATIKGGPSGAKDLAGNPPAADKVWSFKTGYK